MRVVAFYALASGAVIQASATGNFRRNMPEAIPVVILARLAVARAYQGRGLGRAMFRDAAQRVAGAADTIGIRGIIVHAISEEARQFYIALGFDPSPADPMTLLITLKDLSRA
jgi:GNAT superfamily N-acetyltransferase